MERTARVTVPNKYGLHARPAAELVKLANRFRADVWVGKEGLEVNGKSIMGVLMLAAERGSSLTLRASGDDAEDAVSALESLVAAGFGED
jgi:phosphocarrier protein